MMRLGAFGSSHRPTHGEFFRTADPPRAVGSSSCCCCSAPSCTPFHLHCLTLVMAVVIACYMARLPLFPTSTFHVWLWIIPAATASLSSFFSQPYLLLLSSPRHASSSQPFEYFRSSSSSPAAHSRRSLVIAAGESHTRLYTRALHSSVVNSRVRRRHLV
jgi:hypothetical protein